MINYIKNLIQKMFQSQCTQAQYIEENMGKLQYDCFTGTYWLQDAEWEEPMEFTEDELINEGIYLNEYCQRI
jgi:hypothetical protein